MSLLATGRGKWTKDNVMTSLCLMKGMLTEEVYLLQWNVKLADVYHNGREAVMFKCSSILYESQELEQPPTRLLPRHF